MRQPIESLGRSVGLCVLALSLALAIPAGLRAEGRESKSSAGSESPVQVVAAALGLSPDQVSAWISILQARQQALGPLSQQIQQHQQAIAAVLASPNPDPAAVGQLMIETRALEVQAHAVEAQAVLAFHQLLADPQRMKLERIRQAARLSPLLPAFGAVGLL